MRRALLYLIQLALLVAAAIWLAERPGEVRVDWLGWRLETSAAMLVLIVLALAWVLAVLRGLWRWLRRAPGEYVEARRERRREAGYEALGRGLAAVAAGDAAEARRLARKASSLLDEPPLTRLLAAQAAQLSGDEAEAERQFQAMRADPATEFLGLRGLLTKALRDGNRDQALALAERALELKPQAPWLLKQTFALQAEAKKWRPAMATLADAAGRGAINKDEARRARTALLAALAEETPDDGEAKHLLGEAIELTPGFTPAAVALARLHAAAGAERKAIKTLERAWTAAPHPDISRAWLGLKAEAPPLDRMRWLQRLVQSQGDHRESRLALAEAALDAHLWGEARRQLQDLASRPTPRVIRLMARVEREEHADAEAARAWLERLQTAEAALDAHLWGEARRQLQDLASRPTPRVIRLMARVEREEHADAEAARAWLERMQTAEADPVWVCSACGAQATGWSPACGNCSAFDALEWKVPPRVQRIDRPPALLAARAAEPVPEIPPAPATG